VLQQQEEWAAALLLLGTVRSSSCSTAGRRVTAGPRVRERRRIGTII